MQQDLVCDFNGIVHADGNGDVDVAETREWLDSLEAVVHYHGPERARYLLTELDNTARKSGVDVPFTATTPFINTIPPSQQPPFPGNREIERRIKSLLRWNAMAMVVRANRDEKGIGGHISTYASAATLFEIGFNHFFKGPEAPGGADQVYLQGHASPGVYARAFLEGRLTEKHLENFRRELQPGGGLSSYPHPWLMPGFWQFPTVSMGLGPIMAIYQARFNRYLEHRGIKDTSGQHVWCFVGDGETDEPETLGALTLAGREKLDNLIFVVNCNLQRLDGPVRGNGKIIQELEGLFRGAGWNVIKVIWGSPWDPLLEADESGDLIRRMNEVVDGQLQRYSVGADDIRSHFFNTPALQELVKNYTEEQLPKLKRGGHDPEKVYAAYKAAVDHRGQPTCILAMTIKGYGLGEAGEGRNPTHQQKSLNEKELRDFRARFNIPISDDELAETPFYKPADDSPEMRYLLERRKELGGSLPARVVKYKPLKAPGEEFLNRYKAGSGKLTPSTTKVFVDVLAQLLADKELRKHVVPIIPDEARTFGVDPMFKRYGIYSNVGQVYVPYDAQTLLAYHEAKDGVILEEGITEAGSMSSFIAAGTAYATHGIAMVPFFIYYSMFGFQRIGDLIWAAADMRVRGFLLGATAGRTTLNGEGLQHEDGHSHVLASVVPNCLCYDPAFGYEVAAIVREGIRRMYEVGEDVFYYLTLYNEEYPQFAMPEGSHEGILRGLYKLRPSSIQPGQKGALAKSRVHLFGSGPLLREALRAQEILAERYGVAADVWSATSYKELRRDALACERWNMLHPDQPPRKSYVEKVLENESGLFLATSDYMKSVPEMIGRWVPGGLYPLGTDGFGRSESREALRRHFEVDAECVTAATLYRLSRKGEIPAARVAAAIKELGINPDKVDPVTA
jgi:pyruvate dehydrogenase E1 component